ncbi:MAG: hypothetical protein Q8N51_07750, partial [Gammaproteobacteria bacterium]|nr:hypothetical protein [Gammaproteobacteria bacterium]
PVAPPADTVAPVVSFTMPATATSLSVNVLTFSATDSGGVTGYLLNESATKPLASASGWSTTPQGSFTFPAAGSRTLYAWAKDAANNVSTGVSRTVVITTTTPPPPPPPPPPPVDGLLFSDSFSDATKTGDLDWVNLKGNFGGDRGAFTARGRKDNLALVEGVAGLDPFTGGRIEVNVRVGHGESRTTAEVIFDYQDEQNYRYVRLDRNQKRVVIGQVGTFGVPESGVVLDQDTQLAASMRLPRVFFKSRTWHQLSVDLDASAGSVAVYLDGEETPAATAVFDSTGIGRVGLSANRARLRVSFDDFQVWDGPVLP